MSLKKEILSRFSGAAGERPLYLPDLTLWYDWHKQRDTLPDKWRGYTLPQVARAMGVPIWLVARPWRVETVGAEIVTTEQNEERVIRFETSVGTLTARWAVGPDGDWWQTEYPVKSSESLAAVLEVVRARSYVIDPAELARLEAAVGDDGVLALEIPRRPYSDLLHEFLGWSEGLLLLRRERAVIQEINGILETELQRIVQAVAALPGLLVLSPDNLDGQFISPKAFREYLADSYQRTTEALHQHNKHLIVHIGGPTRHILAPLAAAGVDGIEGLAGPPQGDVSLIEAREISGPGLTLWGGIPQDFVVDTHDRNAFEAAVQQAAQEARSDSRMVLGVADRVPVDAELSRLEAIPSLIEQARLG